MKRTILVTVLFVLLFMIPTVITVIPHLNSDDYVSESYDYLPHTFNLAGFTGTGSPLDSNYTSSTYYNVDNASLVHWTANVLVPPPSGATHDINIAFPQAEWKPTTVTNPMDEEKTYLTDWYYEGGTLTIRSSAVDVFGVWKIDFVSLNYMLNVLIGPSGGPYSTTTTLNINDDLAVSTTTPYVTGASVNLVLTDPTGAEWYRSSITTTGTSTHEVPSFQYRKSITINHTKVSADLTNFPVLIDIFDSDLHNTSKVQSDGDDVLFVQDGKILNHDLELFEQDYNTTHAHLVAWVKANLSSTSDTVLTMYYGNPVVGPQENPKAVWSNNYEAVWHLGENAVDEGTGAIHYDSTSGAYDGEQHGNARTVGRAGYGQDFDGTNDVIYINDTKGLNPSGSVTLSGWFKLDSAFSSSSTTSLLIMEKYLDNNNNMHIALVGTDYQSASVPTGALVFKVENSNTQKYIWTTTTSWNTGWYHYSIYMNSSDPLNSQIYINGADSTASGSTGSATWCNLTYSATWGIGGGEADSDFSSGNGYFNGSIDEVRVSTGSRTTAWTTTEYNNQKNTSTFYSVGSENERTSPNHTFTKTIDSTAAAGIWTASVFYNDTGTGVDNRTGLYEREFLVKHNSSLALISPGDAVNDGVSLRVADEMLYVEVELTDDVTSDTISGSTVKMNWSVSGTPINVTLEDYGTGRYGIALNTTDLGTNKRWAITIYSSHPYYNDATTSFYLDLNHGTDLTYLNVYTTPVGQNFTATLVFRDIYDNTPITDATITFANGTPVTIDAQANGQYNISVSTTGLTFGDYWYIFNATKSGFYLEASSVNVTFTLRPHYTTVSVSGDLVTPYEWNTDVTVSIIDTDTGGTVAIGSVSSMTFTWSGGSYAEDPASSFDVTLPTNSWAVGAKTVTLSIVMSDSNYYAPTNYQFDITIRKHYTVASVTGDLVTPYSFDTTITVVITDLDNNVELSSTDVSSLTFTSSYSPYSESSPADLDVTLPTSTWSLGVETVTLAVVMTGNYENPSNYQFDITIRKHYTVASVTGDFVTPYSFDTDVTIVITDLDTGADLTASAVSSFGFVPTHYGPHNESNPTDLDVTLSTSSWTVGTESITLGIVMIGNYVDPDDYVFSIQIRNHYTASSVSGELLTPFGEDTQLTIVITDLDTNTQLAAGAVSQLQFISSYGTETKSGPFTDLDVTLTTNTWSVGTVTVTLTVTLNGMYDNPSDIQFNVNIRKHQTSINVIGGFVTPYGLTTNVTIVITDLDTGGTLAATSVQSFEFSPTGYAKHNETNPSDLDVTLSTDTWSVGTTGVTLAVAMNGDYYDPSSYSFDIQITGLSTNLYHEPNDLIFPNGDAFKIILRVDINEAGPYYGDMITGLVHANFTVHNTTYTYPFTLTEITSGRYNLTIAASYFPEGSYTITVEFNPSNATLTSSQLVITFTYRAARSELSSPDRAVTTPYETDFMVTLNFTDVDRAKGITGATVTATGVVIYDIVDLGTGQYQVMINTTGLAKGEHLYNLTADKVGYQAQTISFKVIIRIAYTSAIPTVGALDIPVGNNPVFYVEYRDIDHDLPIDDSAPFTISTTWIHPIIWQYLSTEGRYKITFPTEVDDVLQQNLIVTFNFTKGENYQFGIFNISVTIRTHHTDLRLVTAVEPTSYNGNITIQLFYGDLDDQHGIWSSYVDIRVENETHVVTYYTYNDTVMGEGYYIIHVPASQFNALGFQNFTIFYNWTGPVYSYQNKSLYVSANIVGEDSAYTLVQSSLPTPYLGNLSYIFFYSELYSGIGITNSSHGGGHVHVYVIFQGMTVDMSKVDIWEVDPVGSPGNYSIRFNTTIFGQVGVIYMEVHVNWDRGVSPFYNNRTDTISIRVLSRDTLVSVNPPAATAFGENATFSFTYEDITGSSNNYIGYDPVKMKIELSIADYTLTYSGDADKRFTISFNTSQFGAPLGQKSFILNVTWTGSPFYGNRTGHLIFITVIARQTVLDYQSPSPTSYLDVVTFTITWTDVAGSSTVGITGATVTLYDGTTEVPTTYYTVNPLANGDYEISFNTSYYSYPGSYSLKVNVTSSHFYYLSLESSRNFMVRYRLTLLSSEPVGSVGYGTALDIVLYYQDRSTLDNIGYSTTLSILNNTGTPWNYTINWISTYQYYLLVIQTEGQPFDVDKTYNLHLNMSFADISPYYQWDDVYVEFSIRNRTSVLEIVEAPLPTPYAEKSVFSMYYKDVDVNQGISGAAITLSTSSGTISSAYFTFIESSGVYTISLNTSALLTLGVYTVTVHANWPGGSPYHDNAQRNVTIRVIERPTNVEIISPPSSTKYLDNVTFTFAYTDSTNGNPISITANDIIIYGNGTQLGPSDFIMNQLGNLFEVSINSTILSSHLVSDYNLTITIDWNAGTAPYYADDSTSLRLSTRGRIMMVEVGSIETTPLGDNLTISFIVSDDSNNRRINDVIIYFDCEEVHIIENVSYWLTRGGSGTYTIAVDTTTLGNIGDFHFNLTVNWDSSLVPYYANRSSIDLIGSVDFIWAVLTSDLPTPSSVQISQDVYVLVYYRDYDHGQTGIMGAGFTVTYLDTGTIPLNLVKTMVSPGVYNISFSTTDIINTGSKTLNITASIWPYTTSSVQPSFTIKVIDTALVSLNTSIQVTWTATARVTVEYEDLLHGNLTTGATVSCVWGGNTLYFDESGIPGRYYIDIDTSLEDAGTQILSITASKTKFTTSLTTVSLVILTLPSSVVPINPAGLVLSSYRGEGANVTIFLNDTYNVAPINDVYVSEVTGVFEGNGISYTFVYNGTPGYYEAKMPGADTNQVDVGFYYFRITVKMRNYNPASYQFTIDLQQTRTILAVDTASGTLNEMTKFYSEVIRLTVRFSELENTSTVLTNASVVWYISDLSIGGNMTENSTYPGLYYTDLDTTIPGYGVWAITFRAVPDDAQFSNAITTMTLTIKRIPTKVTGPDPLTKAWGWYGNLSFVYWDDIFERPVNYATARFSWGPYTDVNATFIGNGTYIVPLNTSVLLPDSKTSITISFYKANYVESNGAVQLTLELIDTSLDVIVSDENKVEDSSRNLIVPMGDKINVTFYYSDIEMFMGGITGATLTPDSELRGDTFSGGHAVTIINLGNGYYSFIFDTTDASLYEYSNGIPVSGQSYRLIMGLHLDNRTTQEVTIRIRIVDVPTTYATTISSPSLSLTHDDQMILTVFFNDTWHGTGVEADFIEAISNNEGVVGVTIAPGTETGQYVVTLTAHGVGTALVTIYLGRQYYSNVTLSYAVQVGPNQTDIMIQQATTIGLPISLLIILLLGLYVKVWSVPKRVRQINGQIRALRKGRTPNPISDAKERSVILADLFNDTYADLGITREPSQLPEESIEVEIPEMGELLMQLTLLTHLSPEELDEFKSDISKMKLSEQAAFVKEVIHQEAIRAARHEGKAVDQVLAELEQAAKKRIGDMESGDYVSGPAEEGTLGESIILTPEPEKPTEPETFFRSSTPEPEVPPPIEPEVRPTMSERLSPFELDELKRQLQERGVPAHEIDTIIEQAKSLSRDLVDELIRSLTSEKD